jgi:hypothetical protein
VKPRSRKERERRWPQVESDQDVGFVFAAAARMRRTCSVAPTRKVTKKSTVATRRAGASGELSSGAPSGSRVEVSVTAGIMWKKSVAE